MHRTCSPLGWMFVSVLTDPGSSPVMNNMPPKRISAAARAATATAAAAAAAAALITATAVEQLIKARVSATLANHEIL
ncbi:hypothetical protein Tco_0927491 [Tanacetum coccineum]